MSAPRVLALVATLTPVGCEYFASPDPLALDPDVISIAIVLVAGESRANLLVAFPHRPVSDLPPKVRASLHGPGWQAAFAHKTDPEDGCGGGPTDWPIPMVCLNAALPEPIRERTTYKLEGMGPMGAFTGEAVVPSAPLIVDPGDTLWLADSIRRLRIPIRYRASPEVGTLRPEMFATLNIGPTGTESKWIPVRPRLLEPHGQADTLYAYELDVSKTEQASLHLLGVGWHYTRFRRSSEFRFPWPNLGVSGEGVYGYFDGSATSNRVHVLRKKTGSLTPPAQCPQSGLPLPFFPGLEDRPTQPQPQSSCHAASRPPT